MPLWKLKITDDEYEELKKRLIEELSKPGRLPFGDCSREACLFFGEYWRREYISGSHSYQMVFDALNVSPRLKTENNREYFNRAARRGAKQLDIETFEDLNRTLDDLLYQGGLPLNSILNSEGKTNWVDFTKKLVDRKIDFDEVIKGKVAKSNTGLREFCRDLCNAMDKKQYRLLPFYCESESDLRYIYFLYQFTKNKKARTLQPFSINWRIDLNSLDEKMTVKYHFSGPQTLKSEFLKQHKLSHSSFLTVQLECNSSVINTFDYIDEFCHYDVGCGHIYHSDNNISVRINGEMQILTSSLDLNTPHLMYQTEDGRYVLGNRLGTFASAIIVPDGWEIENENLYTIKRYVWEDQEFKGILIPADWTEDIVLNGPDGLLTFGSNRVLYWTEITGASLSLPNIRETVYDASKVNFRLCSDGEKEDKRVTADNVKFRNKWSDEWLPTPPIGEIFFKAKSSATDYVQSDRLINVGGGLSFTLLHADRDSCRIKVTWPAGNVRPVPGQLLSNGSWLILKKDCIGTYDIPFRFTPLENPQNEFTLTFKAPFMDFYIEDEERVRIGGDVWLPFSDLDKYRYHIAGMDNIKFTVGENQYRLRWIGEELYRYHGEESRMIPYEGSLIHLLGSREEIRSLLDKTSENMINAQVDVVFNLPERKKLIFFIKESPYRPWQKGNEIIIRGKNKTSIDYRGALRLYKLEDPAQSSVTVEYDPEHGYVLPESIKDWSKTIVTGRTRGRICPAMVEYDRDYTAEKRRKSRTEVIKSISASIADSAFGDSSWTRIIDWFNLSQKEDLPASSFLDLVCAARNADSLIKLAFHLYCEADSEEEQKLLIRKLRYFSTDLAFQWYWMLPFMKNIGLAFSQFITDLKCPVIMRMYFRWAQTMENPAEYILAAASEKYYEYAPGLLSQKIQAFSEWMYKLCKESMKDSYSEQESDGSDLLINDIIGGKCKLAISDHTRYIHVNQSNLDDSINSFFSQYCMEGKTKNENWLMSRVWTVSRHLKGEINLFDEIDLTQEISKCPCSEGLRLGCSQSEESHLQEAMDKADMIRRSIIYCYKTMQSDFVFELNNLLVS